MRTARLLLAKIAKQSFSFDFPSNIDRSRPLSLTMEMTFDGADHSHYPMMHTRQTLPMRLDSPSPCLVLTGSRESALVTRVR